MNKSVIISIIIATVIIGGTFFIISNRDSLEISNNGTPTNNQNVKIENGIQIIELQAKGGYQPRKSIAKAGIPTIIRFNAINTFDCSLSVRIPSLNISQFLAQTEKTDIDIGVQKVGIFRGSCGMGMYPFEIDFQG